MFTSYRLEAVCDVLHVGTDSLYIHVDRYTYIWISTHVTTCSYAQDARVKCLSSFEVKDLLARGNGSATGF